MSKYTEFARGKPCQIRLPGVCNGNPETSVFCHINGGGMAMKKSDIHGAIGCSACHDAVDGRVHSPYDTHEDVQRWFLEAVIRTQEMMIREGILRL